MPRGGATAYTEAGYGLASLTAWPGCPVSVFDLSLAILSFDIMVLVELNEAKECVAV